MPTYHYLRFINISTTLSSLADRRGEDTHTHPTSHTLSINKINILDIPASPSVTPKHSTHLIAIAWIVVDSLAAGQRALSSESHSFKTSPGVWYPAFIG